MTKKLRKYFIFLGLFWVIFIVGVFAESSIADMYKWVDQNGVLHFSDTPPHNVNNSKIETMPTYKTHEENSTDDRDNRPDPADSVQNNPLAEVSKVELYITSWCPYCKKAKNFFQSRGIAFVEYDIEKDRDAARRKAQMDSKNGVPFAVINGTGVHGYSEEAYNNALSH